MNFKHITENSSLRIINSSNIISRVFVDLNEFNTPYVCTRLCCIIVRAIYANSNADTIFLLLANSFIQCRHSITDQDYIRVKKTLDSLKKKKKIKEQL